MILLLLAIVSSLLMPAGASSSSLSSPAGASVAATAATMDVRSLSLTHRRVTAFSLPALLAQALFVHRGSPSKFGMIGSRTMSSKFLGSTRIRVSTPRKTTTTTPPQRRQTSRQVSSSTIPKMMPEGPEVRTIVDQLQQGVGKRLIDVQFLSGRYVKHGRPDGFSSFAKTMTPLTQQLQKSQQQQQQQSQDQLVSTQSTVIDAIDTVVEWNAKGKFIYLTLDGGKQANSRKDDDNDEDETSDFQRSIWITLGMTGQFVSETVHRQDPRYARWYLQFVDVTASDNNDNNDDTTTTDWKHSSGKPNQFKIYYHDQRNFGTLKFCLSNKELQSKLQSLGPDILDVDNTTVDTFLTLLASTSQTINICKFLMNQQKISGVGNYILSEALYRANIDPFASIGELDEDEHRRPLFREIQAVASESYASQGLTRPRVGTYRSVDGTSGSFAFQLQCYGRETCSRGNPVIRETNGPHGRSIWYTEEQLFMPRRHRDDDDSSSSTGDILTSNMPTQKRPVRSSSGTGQQSKKTKVESYGNLVDGIQDPGWKHVLSEATSSESFQNLQQFLKEEEMAGATIFPPAHDVFQALNLCPLNQTKVVIIGQDPYHAFGQAHGLAFSVQRGVPPPPSLKNIFKEAHDDVGIDIPSHGCLESWAEQGVLLLNTVLTVRSGKANSHQKVGWEEFTDAVVAAINQDDTPRVFLLWGRPAAAKAKAVDTSKHVVIQTSHPSPLGATKTATPFLTSRCFSRTNEALVEMGTSPINWQIR